MERVEGNELYSSTTYRSTQTPSSDASFENVYFDHVIGGISGGGIYSESSVTCTKCIFEGCNSGGGGAIHVYSSSGTLNCDQCTFDSCYSIGYGGAIFTNAKLYVSNSNFDKCHTDNVDNREGGAIYLRSSSTASITSCTFRECHASGYGGAVYIANGQRSTVFTQCHFRGCYAKNHGHAVAYQGDIPNFPLFSQCYSDSQVNNRVSYYSNSQWNHVCVTDTSDPLCLPNPSSEQKEQEMREEERR